LIILKAALCIY